MAKTLYGYRIGADVKEPEAPQGVKLVPDNKTLVALPLNDEPDDEVDPQRLKNMKEIFEHYKPSKEVVLKSSDGESDDFNFQFNSLKDFTKDGLIGQSSMLQNQQSEEEIYSRFLDVLKNNESLQQILANEEQKQAFSELLATLIEELGE